MQTPRTIDRARVIATLSNSILNAMEAGKMDERIKALEERLESGYSISEKY